MTARDGVCAISNAEAHAAAQVVLRAARTLDRGCRGGRAQRVAYHYRGAAVAVTAHMPPGGRTALIGAEMARRYPQPLDTPLGYALDTIATYLEGNTP